jgi:energy-converting hydrogenase B subunit D
VLQAIALVLVAAGGTAVVATSDPRRQVLASGFFGICLALLFFCVQAPDVALSQIVVGAVALPAMIVLALGRVREREKRTARSEES